MSVKRKAGLIPYYFNEAGEIVMLFQVSSNPDFGGDKPMISKGGMDEGEQPEECALREAQEELGLISDNVMGKLLPMFVGKMFDYTLWVYACEIFDPVEFNEPHFETAETPWMTLNEFLEEGRNDHKDIVKYIARELKSDKAVGMSR